LKLGAVGRWRALATKAAPGLMGALEEGLIAVGGGI
jgi:hypothetical protein